MENLRSQKTETDFEITEAMERDVANIFLDGSFGKGNLGDDALVNAFLKQHFGDFRRHFVAGTVELPPGMNVEHVRMPVMFSGWRRYKSFSSIRYTLDQWRRECGSSVVYACLGGLLGDPVHVDIRAQVFDMVEKLNWKSAYYFGDIEPGYKLDRSMARIVRFWNRSKSWVGVRSSQAEDLLRSFGVHKDCLFRGVDPVLYERSKRLFNTNTETQARTSEVALVPSFWVLSQARTLEWWRSATIAARDQGLSPRWCIFDATQDAVAALRVCLAAGYSEKDFEDQVLFGEMAIAATERSALCITDRYHGAIYPITAGVPTIARGWNGKIQRLYSMLDLNDWCDTTGSASQSPIPDLKRLVDHALGRHWQPNLTVLQAEVGTHRESKEAFRRWAKCAQN